MSETWPQAFRRRLEDGTAWTTGWTPEEVALPSEPRKIEIVIDRFGDRWMRPEDRERFRNVDQDDISLTRTELEAQNGPLTPFDATPDGA